MKKLSHTQLIIRFVMIFLFTPTALCAAPQATQPSAPQKQTAYEVVKSQSAGTYFPVITRYKRTLNALKRHSNAVISRVKKLFDCLIGQDSCTTEEIITARITAVLIIVTCIELHRSRMCHVWWRKIKQKIVSNLHNNAPDLQQPPGSTTECCVCFESEASAVPVEPRRIPCPNALALSEPLNHGAICRNCLDKLWQNATNDWFNNPRGILLCPICRHELIREPFNWRN